MAKAAKIIKPLRNNPACRRCPLHKKAKTCCCETTNMRKRNGIMLVGEALGANEDDLGRPFVGDAGLKLNYLLARAGLDRKKLSIGNTVKCKPPGNKSPTKSQIDSCYPYLWHDILKLKPKVVVALGSVAYQTVLGELTAGTKGTLKLKLSKRTVWDWRGFPDKHTIRWTAPSGKVHEHTFVLVPTFHPAAALRSWEYDDLIAFDLRLARMAFEGKPTVRWPKTKVRVASTFHEAMALLRRLRRIGRFVIDLETTGLCPHASRTLCIGFCYRGGQADILPIRSQGDKPFWTPVEGQQIIEALTVVLEECELIGQNLKFDLGHLRKLTGVRKFKVVDDTILLHHVLDENKPHNLTFLTQWFLRWYKYDSALDPYKFKKGKKMVLEAKLVPNEKLWEYCGYDVDGTWCVRKKLKPRIKQEGLEEAYAIELALTIPLYDMEFRGINADVKKLRELGGAYRKACSGKERKLQHMAASAVGVIRNKKGEKIAFNPRSPLQLVSVLEKLGANLRKRTPSGGKAVDKYVLAGLALKKGKAGTLSRNITSLRKDEKILTTYLDGKDAHGGFAAHLVNDRWHPNYNIFVARTGRLSADDPAIQTVPRDEVLRSLVIPDCPDHRIIAADYEKIELYIMAWLSNDAVMVEELLSGVDLHTKMAVTARLMRNPTDEEFRRIAPLISKDERAVAKGVNFGIPYGRGAQAIAEANPEAFPATMYPKDRREKVQRVINAYFDKYQGIAEYREHQVEIAKRRGYLRSTVYHRIRHLGGMRWFDSRWGLKTEHRNLDLSHLEREAMNFEIQGIASMTLNDKTRVVHAGIERSRIPAFRIIFTLHDALIYNCHMNYTGRAVKLIKGWMETTLPKDRHHKYELPLRVDASVLRHLGEEYAEK